MTKISRSKYMTRYMIQDFKYMTKISRSLEIFGKRYSWELVSKFITNDTAKMQLKILGRTFRLTSGAIVNAKKLTLCWILSHDAKTRETETEPGEVLRQEPGEALLQVLSQFPSFLHHGLRPSKTKAF